MLCCARTFAFTSEKLKILDVIQNSFNLLTIFIHIYSLFLINAIAANGMSVFNIKVSYRN